MSRKTKLEYYGDQRLKQMYRMGRGTSKYADKRVPGGIKDKIYSRSTYVNYKTFWHRYCNWLHAAHPKVWLLEESAEYRQEWVDYLTANGRSAWTIRSYVQAVCKVTGTTSSDLSMPKRRAQDIVRSRKPVAYDAHYCAANHHDLEVVCRSSGLRRADVEHLRGTDLVRSATSPSGYSIIVLRSKGGRDRLSPLVGPEAGEAIEIMKRAGSNKVFDRVPRSADIHNMRAIYAARLYHEYARPKDAIKQCDIYLGRGAHAGKWYDRAALMVVSRALGHSRCNVVVEHYSQYF